MPAPDEPPVVAAFDVDGTLTTRDSVVPFLWRVAGPGLVRGMLRRAGTLAGALARRDRDTVKELAISAAFEDRDHAEVATAGERWARVIEADRLRADTTDRMRWHQSRGHAVVLVSASLDAYLEPLARSLGLGAVLCSTLEVDGGGRCTGRLVGDNCRGAEKARRLTEWLAGHEAATGRTATLWAYGDSAGDDEMLAMADHPVRVGRPTLSAAPEVNVR